MGKIRVKTLGDESLEKEEKQKRRREREGKKMAKDASQEPTETPTVEAKPEKEEEQAPKKTKKKKQGKVLQKELSKRYKENSTQVSKNTNYPLSKALELLKKLKSTKFDETVELHVNVTETGISGTINLPHGTGKKRVVKIVDEATLEQIEKGKIDFDVLVARPDMMPKLAKVARVLGPRGLMPNPKNGTISPKPEEVVEKLSAGQMTFKTEAKAPIIHISVGKLSFSESQLSENIKVFTNSVQKTRIKKLILKSSMSPAIKVDTRSL